MILGMIIAATSLLGKYVKPAHVSMAARYTKVWYYSLSWEDKQKVDKVITWCVKDLTADVIHLYTGVHVKPLVNKVFEKLGENCRNADSEKYVEEELKKGIEERIRIES